MNYCADDVTRPGRRPNAYFFFFPRPVPRPELLQRTELGTFRFGYDDATGTLTRNAATCLYAVWAIRSRIPFGRIYYFCIGKRKLYKTVYNTGIAFPAGLPLGAVQVRFDRTSSPVAPRIEPHVFPYPLPAAFYGKITRRRGPQERESGTGVGAGNL